MKIDKLKFYRLLSLTLCLLLMVSISGRFKNSYKKTEKLENNDNNSYTEYLFLGDSITNNYTLQKYYPEYPIINSGIGGDRTKDVLDNLDARVFKYKPKKVIILVGINDLTHFKNPKYVSNNIKKIASKIKDRIPKCEIYIESIYPVNYSWKDRYEDDVPSMDTMIENIKETNKKLCDKNNYEYIDAFDILEDDDMLAKKYSKDGIHLNEDGYEAITKLLKEKVFKERKIVKGAQI